MQPEPSLTNETAKLSKLSYLKNKIKAHKGKIGLFWLICLLAYYWCLPAKLFDAPTSTVLFDNKGGLLGAKIATDGQWRFPANDTVPEKFKRAIIAFEDKRFYTHWGVDVQALGRAIWQNVSSGDRVSGASTLTMQTIRLARHNPSRNFIEKIKEMILATRIEWSYSKDEILAMYASYAPFGGNVVGLDAAAWKYYGRAAGSLSWAEAAVLAVLPNAPSLIHISKNRNLLRAKRDRLLDKLYQCGDIDSLTCALSKLEQLPAEPRPLPMLAYHLLEQAHQKLVLTKKLPNGIIHSSLDNAIQTQVLDICQRYAPILRANQINNLAALVINAETNQILAYIGNSPHPNPLLDKEHGYAVDIPIAPRSSGSILKPFLYAAMLTDGEMLPNMLYPDIPTHFKGYTPKNFENTYSGAVKASEVIRRSLNIPAIYMLNQYGITRFLHKLKTLGMRTLQKSAEHYGLTLILGGAEVTLWDLAGMYAGMVRDLANYRRFDSKYATNNYRPISYLNTPVQDSNTSTQSTAPLSAGAIWFAFHNMQEVARPGEEGYWRSFLSANKVAWKTGTSFGFRDAWAVGCTPKYVVAVWAGNADGEGRPGLLGVKAAAPLLFEIFNGLGSGQGWFSAPYDDMRLEKICSASGHVATGFCTETHEAYVQRTNQPLSFCPYHKTLFLSADGKYRVHSDCEQPANMRTDTFFMLPPAQEWFYKRHHLISRPIPEYRPDCLEKLAQSARNAMAFLYPTQNGLKIYIPTNLDETQSQTVFELAHSRADATVFWHLDNEFIATTQENHQLALRPPVGKHTITVVDEQGERLSRTFEIMTK